MGSDRHRRLTQELQERAALHVLGGMESAEDARFKAHIESCQPCRDEVEQLEAVVSELALAAPSAEPPAGLRERTMSRVRGRPAALLPAAEREWIASDLAGVVISQLWLDTERRRHTTLVRMEAGTTLPLHRHAGPEECFVLEGDLGDESGLLFTAGDYVRFEAATEHRLATQGGCLLLITASLDDQRIDSD